MKKQSNSISVTNIRRRVRAPLGPILTAAVFLGLSVPVSAATLQADYRFEGNFNSEVPGRPLLVLGAGSGTFGYANINGKAGTPNYDFTSGTDLRLNSTGLIPTNEYSIAMLFKLNANANGYKTILDVRDPIIDDHLYIDPSGNLNWPSIVASPPHVLSNGVYYTLVMTRTASDNKLRGYIDGVSDFTLTDSAGRGDLSASQIIHFFKDDGGSEQTSGSVARIQLYNGVLSGSEVAALQLEIPEPSSMVLLGLAALMYGRRR